LIVPIKLTIANGVMTVFVSLAGQDLSGGPMTMRLGTGFAA